ncbi:hypothetical protein TSO5_05260 [Azospirillum sp. TSO5]|nr:hypothetical protein TSO5_05260 [Azospirillum sp. TSO5]
MPNPNASSDPIMDAWTAAGLPSTEAVMAGAGELAGQFLRWHGAPRIPELLGLFCRELPAGRVLLYGAGTLTQALLGHLPDGIRVAGIIDRRAGDIATFCGFPVLSAAEALDRQHDYVLLAHNAYEMEMAATLVKVGFAADRIVALHADPRYRAFIAPTVERLVEEACRHSGDAAIVNCNSPIIHDRQLADWLPPDRTIQLFMGRSANELDRNGLYETVDLRESLDALRAALLRRRPRVVYVRSMLFKNYLGMLIKRWLPRTTVVQEFYDYATLWPDADLANLFGLNAVSMDWLRRAELIAGQTLDLVISKRGGAQWHRVQDRCRAPYRLVFPQMVEGPPDRPGPPRADLVYAGFLPSRSFLRSFPVGYNFMPLLEDVCRDGGLTADIFNAAHNGAEGDAIFADYLRDYEKPPLAYHRRLSYSELMDILGSYRFGWLCNDQRTVHPDRQVGICNRWTGYLSAGLPVLLDASWGAMGDLTREYGAGLVIERLESGTVIDTIRNADHTALAAGARRLRSHLLAVNAAAMIDIAAVIGRGLERGV